MKTLFRGAKIIDGTGAEAINCGEILIEDERIVEIAQVNQIDNIDSTASVIDLNGKVILPGMIDSHVHIIADAYLDGSLFVAASESQTLSSFRALKNMETLLRSGITYVRDVGCPDYINIELRNARQMGLIDGIELKAAGKCLTITGGHIWKISRQCDGVSDVRKAVREQFMAGADCIKIAITGGHSTPGVHPKTVQFTQDEIEAAVEITHLFGKKIAAHTNGLQAIKMAVDAGVDSIEHCEFFPEDDPDQVADVMDKMARQGTFYVPTIIAHFKDYPPEHGYLGEIKKEVLPILQLRQLDHIRPSNMKREYFSMQQIIDNAKRLYQAGVKIAMGTDSGIKKIHFGKYPFEMKSMLLIGMSPMEVIVSATKTAAELLDIDSDYGTLEKGKIADFVVLENDPLDNMDALYDISQVYKKGVSCL